MQAKCHFCDEPGTYGYRKPGLLSEQTRKGYLWSCLEHRDKAEEIWRKSQNTFSKEGQKS